MDVFAAELYEVLPRASWSRRGFLVTTLATGFAVAAGPISAETITTDTIGLDVAEVKVPTADGEMPAYRAMPATGGPFATILVVQEIFGVHELGLANNSPTEFRWTLGTTSRNPNFPVSQIDNSKAQRFEGVANRSVTSGTVGTSGWDKIRSWVNAICLACIIAGCFVVGVDLMTKANPDLGRPSSGGKGECRRCPTARQESRP
jgi:hypothetical protein